MPQITNKRGEPSNFTDTNVAAATAINGTSTWFSDPTAKGLQLCVTAGGVKTWYVNKWDPTAQKTRRIKLGQWSTRGMHTAWAKDQVGKVVLDVKEGVVKTRDEKAAEAAAVAAERAGIPTLREAFELEATYRLNLDDAYGGPRAEETIQNYRRALDKYVGELADVQVDVIDSVNRPGFAGGLFRLVTRPWVPFPE